MQEKKFPKELVDHLTSRRREIINKLQQIAKQKEKLVFEGRWR